MKIKSKIAHEMLFSKINATVWNTRQAEHEAIGAAVFDAQHFCNKLRC